MCDLLAPGNNVYVCESICMYTFQGHIIYIYYIYFHTVNGLYRSGEGANLGHRLVQRCGVHSVEWLSVGIEEATAPVLSKVKLCLHVLCFISHY